MDELGQGQENISTPTRLGDGETEGTVARKYYELSYKNILQIGDILLRVSGVPLSGLSLRQALDILRSSPGVTVLQVCRVSDNSGNSWSACAAAPRSGGHGRASIVRSYSYGPVSAVRDACPALDMSLPRLQLAADPASAAGDSGGTPRSTLSLCSGESMDIEISPPSPSTSSGQFGF